MKNKKSRSFIWINIIIILLVIVLGVLEYVEIQEEFCDYSKEDRIIEAALEVQSFAKRAEGHMGLYISLGDEVDRDKFYIRIEGMKKNIKILEKEIVGDNDEYKLQRIKNASIGLLDSGDILIEIYRSDPENFDIKNKESILKSIRNSVSIIRENAGALAQSSIVNSSIEISSLIKQAESHLLLLYFNLGDARYKQKYYEDLEDLNEYLFKLESDVVVKSEKDYIKTIKIALIDVNQKGEELISAYDSNKENFDIKNYEEQVREFHDASSLIRKTSVILAKEELVADKEVLIIEGSAPIYFVFKIILVLIIVLVVIDILIKNKNLK